MILKSGTMLHFAQSLVAVGDLYYSCQSEINQINSLRDALWKEQSEQQANNERADEQNGEKTYSDSQIETPVVYDEIEILDNYITILGREVDELDERIAKMKDDVEIAPAVAKHRLEDHVVNLFREIGLNLEDTVTGYIAIAGFTGKSAGENALLTVLNEMALVEMAKLDDLKIVERSRLSSVLEEQKLQLSGLADTDTAVAVGKLVAAQHILTGTVIEMPSSVVIFG